jgi:hypothetical protein
VKRQARLIRATRKLPRSRHLPPVLKRLKIPNRVKSQRTKRKNIAKRLSLRQKKALVKAVRRARTSRGNKVIQCRTRKFARPSTIPSKNLTVHKTRLSPATRELRLPLSSNKPVRLRGINKAAGRRKGVACLVFDWMSTW